MNICAIDQSLTNSGIAILDNNKEIITDSIQPKNIGVERLVYIRDKLKSILLEFKVGILIMESPAYSQSGHLYSLYHCLNISLNFLLFYQVQVIFQKVHEVFCPA